MTSQLGRALVLLVLVVGAIAFFAAVALSRSTTASETVPVPHSDTEARVDAVRDQLYGGEVVAAAFTALDALNALPGTAAAIDEAVTPMQLLSFIMCSLLSTTELQDFLDSLDPETYPADSLALMAFYYDFRGWKSKQESVPIPADADYWDWLRALSACDNGLVRMGARLYRMHQRQDISQSTGRDVLVGLVNGMAEDCPDCRVTGACFHVVIRQALWQTTEDSESGGAAPHPETIADLLLQAPWNAVMRARIDSDPLVESIQDVMVASLAVVKPGEDELTALIAGAAAAGETHADPEVRAWYRATFGPCLTAGKNYSPVAASVRTALLGMTAPDAAKSAKSPTPLDTARAQFILFSKPLRNADAVEASAVDVDTLLTQKREVEPVEINLFENIPKEINYYAHRLVNQRDYREAVAVFQRMADVYPNSDLARRCQENIDLLRPYCK